MPERTTPQKKTKAAYDPVNHAMLQPTREVTSVSMNAMCARALQKQIGLYLEGFYKRFGSLESNFEQEVKEPEPTAAADIVARRDDTPDTPAPEDPQQPFEDSQQPSSQ